MLCHGGLKLYGPFRADAPEATAARWAATRVLVLQVLETQIAAYKQAMENGAVVDDDAAYSAALGAMRAINGLPENVFKPAQSTKEVRKYVASWCSPAQLARRDSVGGGLLAAPGHDAPLWSAAHEGSQEGTRAFIMSVREAAVKHGARAAFNVLAAASMYPLLVRDMLPMYGSAAADVRVVTLLSAHGVPGAIAVVDAIGEAVMVQERVPPSSPLDAGAVTNIFISYILLGRADLFFASCVAC